MTSLGRNDDVIWQLSDTKLISLWFSTTPPNFILLSLIVLELRAAALSAPPPPRPSHPQKAQAK